MRSYRKWRLMFLSVVHRWLLHPIIKGPEGSLREMLKTRTKSSPEKTGAESWKERAREGLEPSEEELASLREKAADLSQSLAEFPRHWMGLVLPSQRNVEGGAFTFRPQGLRQCHSFEDFLDRILPLLKILHASLAYEPRLFAAVLGVLKEGMAETPSSEEKRRRRHRLLVRRSLSVLLEEATISSPQMRGGKGKAKKCFFLFIAG